MKKLYRKTDKSGKGTIGLIPEHREDIWHIYNLIAVGDLAKASTLRKVVKSGITGNVNAQRVKIVIEILIETITVDLETNSIRLSGRNQTQSPHIQMGQYHTLQIEPDQRLHITKERWDQMHRKLLNMSLDNNLTSELVVILMQQEVANFYIVTSFTTIHKAKIEVNIPKKNNYSSKNRDKALTNFYEKLYNSIQSLVDFSIVKCLLIGSPGFYKDDFKKWLFEKATKENLSLINDNKEKFLFVHCSSAHRQSLSEIMAEKSIIKRINNTKILQESEKLNEFFKIMAKEGEKAIYGFNHVEKAVKRGAVIDLIVTDDFLRGSDIGKRRKIGFLSRKVERSGGSVVTFSVLHNSGEYIKGLGGCAAILSYGVSDVSCDDSEDE